MEKAKNLVELSQVFDPQDTLKIDKNGMYKEIYGKQINDLRVKTITNQVPSKTFFISGQMGTGKSTALNHFSNEAVEKKYSIEYISGKELFSDSDINIIDVLLMIGFHLAEKGGLEEEYYQQLEDLKKVNLETLVATKENITHYEKDENLKDSAETGLASKILVIAKITKSYFKNLKRNEKERLTAREIFAVDKAKLIDLVNEIIFNYKKDYLKDNRNVLLIIDDLEKIENRDDIRNIFIKNNWVFSDINCVKIIPIPVYLPRDNTMFKNDLVEFGLRITSNPINPPESEDTKKEENIKKLEELIDARIGDDTLIDKTLYPTIIQSSGGNIRQLMEIIYQSAINALTVDFDATEIIEENITNGINIISDRLSKPVDSKIKILTQILTHHKQSDEPTPQDIENLDISLLGNLVFANTNGTPWYSINPLIKKTVEAYGTKTNP